MTRVVLCKLAEVATGRLTQATLGRAAIVLTRLPDGRIRAFAGRCPHQGGPLAAGCVTGVTTADRPNELQLTRLGEVIRCPWHGFEWDMVTGQPLVAEPADRRLRLRFLDVAIDGCEVVVSRADL